MDKTARNENVSPLEPDWIYWACGVAAHAKGSLERPIVYLCAYPGEHLTTVVNALLREASANHHVRSSQLVPIRSKRHFDNPPIEAHAIGMLPETLLERAALLGGPDQKQTKRPLDNALRDRLGTHFGEYAVNAFSEGDPDNFAGIVWCCVVGVLRKEVEGSADPRDRQAALARVLDEEIMIRQIGARRTAPPTVYQLAGSSVAGTHVFELTTYVLRNED